MYSSAMYGWDNYFCNNGSANTLSILDNPHSGHSGASSATTGERYDFTPSVLIRPSEVNLHPSLVNTEVPLLIEPGRACRRYPSS